MKPVLKKFGEGSKAKRAEVETSTEKRSNTPTNPSIGSKVYSYNPFDSFDENDESYGYLVEITS